MRKIFFVLILLGAIVVLKSNASGYFNGAHFWEKLRSEISGLSPGFAKLEGLNLDSLRGELEQFKKYLSFLSSPSSTAPQLSRLDKEVLKNKLAEIKKKILTPGPLFKNPTSTPESGDSLNLTASGVIYWTNAERGRNNIKSLNENSELDKIASLRAADLFEKQYFEHISPTGIGVSRVAEENGYQYILIGENLALGNFAGDKSVVQAWMGSPGHRENILNQRYREIGVAVKSGVFKGDRVWISVQVFSLPLSACQTPDGVLKAEIDAQEKLLKNLEAQAATLKSGIDNTPADSSGYNAKIDSYNELAGEINGLISNLKNIVPAYNLTVETFNTCVKG